MKAKISKVYTPTVEVIVDTRDASCDRLVPQHVARELHQNGKLDWDITNGKYCTPESGVLTSEISGYPRRG